MKIKHTLIIVLSLILVTFFAGRMSTLSSRNAQNEQLAHLSDSLRVYEARIAGVDQDVYEKLAIIATQEEAIAAGLLEQDRLRALGMRRAAYIARVNAELDAARDSIILPDSIFITDTIVAPGEGQNNYAKLPFSWEYNDQWVELTTGIDEYKLGSFELNANVPLVLTLGPKDSGRDAIAVTTLSPYVTISDITLVNIREQKWYDEWYVIPAASATLGLGLGYLLWGR